MRIALISDLHVDINRKWPVIDMVADAARVGDADMLIVAGDISSSPELTLREMNRLQAECEFPVRYVPGNHDMWNKHCPDEDADEIYSAYYADEKCLSGQVYTMSDGHKTLKITGDIGWYDGSLASPDYSRMKLHRMKRHGRTWQDKLFNAWTNDNSGRLTRQLKILEDQLRVCGSNPILVVTHMIPIHEFCVPASEKDWDYFNGFLGSEALEELFTHYPVMYAVCGHVHYRKTAFRDGIRHICPCLGYSTEWPYYGLTGGSARANVDNAMKFLEV